MTFSYKDLLDAIGGNAVGIRAHTPLAPLGGKGDKIFPPTYGVSERAATKYAIEERRVNGEAVASVVLDSVASQSNRQELALLEERRDGAPVPVVSVDFSDTEIPDLDRITSLEASHRVFDALFRDSLNGDLLFRLSPEGRQITEATARNAAALLRFGPTTLLFGGWDSTGPKGGLGAKYERAITSEIVAVGVSAGVKTSSRLDVLAIEKSDAIVYEAADPDEAWTLDATAAKSEKGKPLAVGKGTDLGRPSQINHGNIVPSIDTQSGGITADSIAATSVISFAQLRRLRFPLDAAGVALGDNRADAERAARAALAALGLLGIIASVEQGFDLRSRCVLVAERASTFELVGRTLEDVTPLDLTIEDARALLSEAVADVRAHGLQWAEEDLVLVPAPKLVELIARSREKAMTEGTDDQAGE